MQKNMQKNSWRSARLIASVIVLAGSGHAFAQQDSPGPLNRKVTYSPYPAKTFPNRVYFGDTHLHTSYSTDAGMIGNTLGPEEAYRFARGEQLTSSTGLPAKLGRPLSSSSPTMLRILASRPRSRHRTLNS